MSRRSGSEPPATPTSSSTTHTKSYGYDVWDLELVLFLGLELAGTNFVPLCGISPPQQQGFDVKSPGQGHFPGRNLAHVHVFDQVAAHPHQFAGKADRRSSSVYLCTCTPARTPCSARARMMRCVGETAGAGAACAAPHRPSTPSPPPSDDDDRWRFRARRSPGMRASRSCRETSTWTHTSTA